MSKKSVINLLSNILKETEKQANKEKEDFYYIAFTGAIKGIISRTIKELEN